MVEYVNGASLSLALQAEAKRRYVHRFTCTHVPGWARLPRPDGTRYEPQFADCNDWLANTDFPVTSTGRLSDRPSTCRSRPTWPCRS